MATTDETLLTVSETATRLNCSESHVYMLIHSGELRHYRIGRGRQGGVRVSGGQLTEYLQRKERGGKPQPPAPRNKPQPLRNLSL